MKFVIVLIFAIAGRLCIRYVSERSNEPDIAPLNANARPVLNCP
jgi:hypothetical protein